MSRTGPLSVCGSVRSGGHDEDRHNKGAHAGPGVLIRRASGLSDSHAETDDNEIIEPERMTVAEVEAAMANGTISEGKSLAIFWRARLAGLT